MTPDIIKNIVIDTLCLILTTLYYFQFSFPILFFAFSTEYKDIMELKITLKMTGMNMLNMVQQIN